MARLADTARSDGARFADVVRCADRLIAAGLKRDAAYASALESLPGIDSDAAREQGQDRMA